MTEREAFDRFATNIHSLAGLALWQAACKYQRQKDAEICRRTAESFKGGWGSSRFWDEEGELCAQAIEEDEPDQA